MYSYRQCKYKEYELNINDFVRIESDDSHYEDIAKIVTMYDYDGRYDKIGVYRFYK